MLLDPPPQLIRSLSETAVVVVVVEGSGNRKAAADVRRRLVLLAALVSGGREGAGGRRLSNPGEEGDKCGLDGQAGDNLEAECDRRGALGGLPLSSTGAEEGKVGGRRLAWWCCCCCCLLRKQPERRRVKENFRGGGGNCGEECREVLVVSIEALSAGSKTIAGCNISELGAPIAGY